MATIKSFLRKSTAQGGSSTVVYRVSQHGQTRQIASKVRIDPKYWDAKRGCVADVGELELAQSRRAIAEGEQELRSIAAAMDAWGTDYSAQDVIDAYCHPRKGLKLLEFMRTVRDECNAKHSFGTALAYDKAIRSFSQFLQGGDMLLSELSHITVSKYEHWLLLRGVMRNTVSFYMRALRSCYNKAVKQKLVEQAHPFEYCYTGVDKTRKRAVNEELISWLCCLDLSSDPRFAMARDLFLFSFATRGMSFVDMAFLKKSDVFMGSIYYQRHKSGKRLAVQLEPFMKGIIDKYCEADSPYIFPLLHSCEQAAAHREYKSALNYWERKLHDLGRKYCHGAKLSFLMARHSWATLARNHNVPISVISAGMGHSSQRTTEIYLAELDNSLVDQANHEILRVLE